MFARAHRVVGFAFLGVAIAASSGCSFEPSPEQIVMDRVKENSKNEDWYSHVTDWNAGTIADFGVETDYDASDVDAYVSAVAICEAIMAEVAEDAKGDVLTRVYGIETTTRTAVDGSTTSRQDEEMMAQFSTIYGGTTCGATAPVDLEEQIEALGVPLF